MSNRQTLKKLIEQAGITNSLAAEHIATETKRPCSARAIQSWLAKPSLSSARPCPAWAVNALESRLKFLGLCA
jgi:hypothetical protein